MKLDQDKLNSYYEDFLEDQMYPDAADYNLSRQEMRELYKYDWDKKKFKHRKKNNNNRKYKIGDKVFKSGVVGKIIDIDEDLVCVDVNGSVEIWNINDIRVAN